MSAFTEIAYAKINLALHVRRKRDDGYHDLDTLFAFADRGDVLTAHPADRISLEVIGPFSSGLSSGPDNLVLRAAAALQSQGQGARLVLHKNLPIASGIGGGSADAAAALRLLSRLWAVETDLMPIAASLGADVPACLLSKIQLGEGIGDELTLFDGKGISKMPILLVNPGIACPTGPTFSNWDGIDRGRLDPQHWIQARNDLEVPAIALHPEIAKVLSVLNEARPRIARMSGSGATCFALFDTAAARDAAQRTISDTCADWWTMASFLR
jgi:4-diphosphocytidyl-2-C-methyl-D-erythritol kinase